MRQVLWVFGPPAAGKSTLAAGRTEDLFGAQGSVSVDGDEMLGTKMVHISS